MVKPFTKLADFSGNASWLCRISNLRRSQSKITKTHYQTWKLCLSTQLHPIGSMGNRLCNDRRQYLTNHSTKQVTLSGTFRRIQRRILPISGWPDRQSRLKLGCPSNT